MVILCFASRSLCLLYREYTFHGRWELSWGAKIRFSMVACQGTQEMILIWLHVISLCDISSLGNQTCCLCVKAVQEPLILSGLRCGRLYLVSRQVNRLWPGWRASHRNKPSWLATPGPSCFIDGSRVPVIHGAVMTPLKRVYLSFRWEMVWDEIAKPCREATSHCVLDGSVYRWCS